MTRFDNARRFALGVAAVTAAGLLAACGQGATTTKVVLTGPTDKVEALIAQHKLLKAPVQAQVEKLPDGREHAVFVKVGAGPASELIDLGKAAAKAGVSLEFSSGTQWGVGSPGEAPTKAAPASKAGPVA
jgi:hypothetical protein